MKEKTVGELIAEARERAGLSKRKLSILSGISHTEIKRIESGEREVPSAKSLKSLCRYLDLYYNDLMYMIGMGNYNCSLNPSLMDYYSNLNGKEVDSAWLTLKSNIKSNNEVINSLKTKKNTEELSSDEINILIDTIKDLEYENITNTKIVNKLENTMLKERFEYAREKFESVYQC